MNAMLLKIIIVLFAFGTTACQRKTSLIISKNFDGLSAVNEWKISGPFEYDTLKQNSTNTFQNKDLEPFGIDEENFNENDFDKLKASKFAPIIIKCPNSPVRLFDYFEKATKKNKSNYYLYTTIYSKCEQDVVFIFDGSRSYKIWINKVNVLEVHDKENTIKNGDRFLRIKLRKGNNSIFAKVNRGTNQYSWGIMMAITTTSISCEIYKEKYLTDFVNDPFISDSLSLYLGPYNTATVTITDVKGNVILNRVCENKSQKDFLINCKDIPNGLLSVNLSLGHDTIQEIIYKGDMLDYVKKLSKEAIQLNCPKKTREDIKVAIDRLDFLVEKLDESSESGIRYYHRNILFYCKNLLEQIDYVKKNKHNRFLSGTVLKSYYSLKDSIEYHFLFHIHKKHVNSISVPVVFFIPYALEDESMARSWYIGNLDQITLDSKSADEYGFATVWLFLKGRKYRNSKDAVEDVKNAIEIIKNDYNIDTTKIFLNGECIGGQRALLIAERCPDLFAGVSVRCPVTKSGDINDRPIDFVQNLLNIPVCIHHGLNDKEVSIQDTRDFATEANTIGKSIKVIETSTGHFNLTNAERRYNFIYFDSLSRLPRTRIVNKIRYITFESSSTAYWTKINKIITNEKAEINANYDSLKHVFNIQTENILSYNILMDKLSISPNSNISIYTNGTLSYEGPARKNEISISAK